MKTKYVFKIRIKGDLSTWENIRPVTGQAVELLGEEHAHNAKNLAQTLLRVNRDAEEVRYNQQGSPQGHYVRK